MNAQIETSPGRLFSELFTLRIITSMAKDSLLQKCRNYDSSMGAVYEFKVNLIRALGITILNPGGNIIKSTTQLIMIIPERLIGARLNLEQMPEIKITSCRCNSIWGNQ